MLGTVVLDVNGTLTDPSALGEVWGRPELGDHILGQAVFTAMVDAVLSVRGHTFSDHLRAAIQVVVGGSGSGDLDPEGIEKALAVAAALPARAGAGDALGTLRDAGVRLIALTNSGAQGGQRTLEGCGLASFFDLVLGVDAVETFKPHPDVYAYALARLAAEPARVALLATHPWDLAGGAHAGLRTAWVRHGSRTWPAVFPDPDVQADSLPDLARELLAHSW